MNEGIGLKYIALELGVSINAVSRALRDLDDISNETKIKIWEKAIELGYTPLEIAKSQSSRNSKTIAILVDSLKSPYFGMIIEIMIDELKQRGYKSLIIPTNINVACKENIKEAINFNVDGIITFLIPNYDAYILSVLYKVPMLLFGRYYDLDKLNLVYMDDFQGGEIACDYLVNDKQASKLCYVGVSSIECSQRRKAGFIKRAQELNISDVTSIEAEQIDSELKKLINNGYKKFFCFDDQLASIVINYKNSNDFNVIGFNGTSRFYYYAYNITSIEADYYQMTKTSIELIIQKINHNNEGERIIRQFDTKLYLGNT